MKEKTRWKKWALIAAAAAGVAVAAAAAGGYIWYRRSVSASLPQTHGRIPLAGLNAPVEIFRDVFGIPHIYATNEPDLYFGMGYAMAQDRLWQMDFLRRLGQGRLAEILGPELLPVDRFFRTISAGTRLAPQNDPSAFITEAFTRGVNAYLGVQQHLPLEFKLLGYRPQPWSESDQIAVLRVMNWGLSMGWKVDLTAARMLQAVGEEKFKDAFPAYPSDGPLVISAESLSLESLVEPVAELIRTAAAWTGHWTVPASNNWVIAGHRSVSGKPVLANDTHLGLTHPPAWWEVHMACPTLDAAGFAIPGLPGLAVGHNLHAAWGVTTVMADDVDFYIERIDPANPRKYWNGSRWETMQTAAETIDVKGANPVTLEIEFTRNGPIFKERPGLEGHTDQALSVRWTGREVVQTVAAVHRIARAETTADIVEALRHWHMPGQNVVFADTRGNIGYWCCATIPVRQQPFGLLPVPGWMEDFQWNGWVPFEQLPHEINPKRGFIASANNRVAGPAYPFHIGSYWEPQDRIARIHQLLDTDRLLAVSDFMRMQADVTCLLAAELVPLLSAVIEKQSWDDSSRQAGELLARWDFQMDKASPAACLFEVTFHKLLQNIFKDELDAELYDDYMRTVIFPPRALRHIIRSAGSAWVDDIHTAPVETLEDIIETSLREAIAELRRTDGAEPSSWRWGRRHTLSFEHMLGRKKPLDRLFNIGPFSVGGNHLTVNMALYHYDKPFAVYHGPSQRMIVDLADPSKALHVLPTGESGLLGSTHADDQVQLYLNGRYRPAWMSRADVEGQSPKKLVLVPAAAGPG